MAIPTQKRLVGLFALVLVPLVLGAWLYYLLPRWGGSDTVVFILAVLFYLLIMAQKVTYERSRIRGIDMSDLPNDIRDILTTTTSKGDYINLIMLGAFKKGAKLSQTDLYKESTKFGVELSQPAVRPYIATLETSGLIVSPDTPYAKEYSLTQRGKLCLEAITQLLPNRYWKFLLRNELGIRKIPKFSATK